MDGIPTLFVVENDVQSAKELVGIGSLLKLQTRVFFSANEFFSEYKTTNGCLVLENELSDRKGIEFQNELIKKDRALPIIMIGEKLCTRTVVASMKLGAITFLQKPIFFDEICREIEVAVEICASNRRREEEFVSTNSLVQTLTNKERDVLDLVVTGQTNKQMAQQLGLSLRGIEDRRSKLMKKLNAKDIWDLIEITRRLMPPDRLDQSMCEKAKPNLMTI